MQTSQIIAVVAAIISFVAASVSVATYVRTRREKLKDDARAGRLDLSEAIAKLNDVFERSAQLRFDMHQKWSEPSVVAYRRFLNGQKMFWATQAVTIMQRHPDLMTDGDLDCVARAFADNHQFDLAAEYLELAASIAPLDHLRAVHLRGRAAVLLKAGITDAADDAFDRALRLVEPNTDANRWFIGETYQLRALAEREVGDWAAAQKTLVQAGAAFSSITFAAMKEQGLRNIEALARETRDLRPSS